MTLINVKTWVHPGYTPLSSEWLHFLLNWSCVDIFCCTILLLMRQQVLLAGFPESPLCNESLIHCTWSAAQFYPMLIFWHAGPLVMVFFPQYFANNVQRNESFNFLAQLDSFCSKLHAQLSFCLKHFIVIFTYGLQWLSFLRCNCCRIRA